MTLNLDQLKPTNSSLEGTAEDVIHTRLGLLQVKFANDEAGYLSNIETEEENYESNNERDDEEDPFKN